MPGSASLSRGNIANTFLLEVALTPSQVAQNTSAEQTFTVQGLNLLDFVNVTKPTFQAGLAIGNARVSAANTLAITYANNTGSPITPTAETYLVMVDRAENAAFGASGFPNGVY